MCEAGEGYKENNLRIHKKYLRIHTLRCGWSSSSFHQKICGWYFSHCHLSLCQPSSYSSIINVCGENIMNHLLQHYHHQFTTDRFRVNIVINTTTTTRGEGIVFWWPNMNMKIIWLFKNERIRILFGLKKATEYKHKYYLAWKKQPNTNMNTSVVKYRIIRSPLPVMRVIITSFMGPSYECYSVWRKSWPNTNTNIIRFENIDRIRIRILFGLKKSLECEYKY